MKNAVYFCNMGEMDHRSFKVFGLHAKESNDAFGMFGTGLKYAIAILVRLGKTIHIKSGDVEYNIRGVEEDFRGQKVQMIYANDDHLGFTTHLGSHWELWQAYRELASNAYDEGGVVTRDKAEADQFTTVVSADIGEVRHEDVFLGEKPNHNYVYCKGVRVYDLKTPSYFPVIMPDGTDLTEDRTVRYNFRIQEVALNNLILCHNERKVHDCLTSDNFEMRECSPTWLSDIEPGPSFKKVITLLTKESRLHSTTLKILSEKYADKEVYDGQAFDPSDRQKETVEWAKAIATDAGYSIDDFPIVYKTDLTAGTLAQAKDNEIILTDRLLNQDRYIVLHALIEEWAHLKHGYKDLERDFQTWIFTQLAEKCVELYQKH